MGKVMKWLRSMLPMLALISLSSTAQAGLISIVADPGVAGSIGLGNDLLDDIYGMGVVSRGGYLGASISVTGPASLKFTYLGSEAAYLNKLVVGGADQFANHGPTQTAVDDMFSYAMGGAGLIPFYFLIDDTSSQVINCPTGTDCSREFSPPRFFTSFDELASATEGNSLVVFLDDGGGNNDQDFDDMAVRISAEPVPEPGSLLLVGSGLAALLARRRARRNGGVSRPMRG